MNANSRKTTIFALIIGLFIPPIVKIVDRGFSIVFDNSGEQRLTVGSPTFIVGRSERTASCLLWRRYGRHLLLVRRLRELGLCFRAGRWTRSRGTGLASRLLRACMSVSSRV